MNDPDASCPYCQNIPGIGPKKSGEEPKNAFDTPIATYANVVCVPALGMLVPGSFLAISTNHVYSFAHFGIVELDTLEAYIQSVTKTLEPLFGEYLIFEHGASEHESQVSHGGCITHAHFHLFPVAREVGPIIEKSLPFERLRRLSDISKQTENTYALYSIDNTYHLSKSPNLPSQWIRRIVVEALGSKKHWDWGVDFGYEELAVTLEEMKKHKIQVMGAGNERTP